MIFKRSKKLENHRKRFPAIFLGAAFAICCWPSLSSAETSAGDVLTAVDLRCQWSSKPLAVEDAQPLLSWAEACSRRKTVQSAYQILVATQRDLLVDGKADLWDSGKVASNAMSARYAGKPLEAARQVFWTVRLGSQDGKEGAWAKPATWTMGLPTAESWAGAKWIASADEGNSLPLLRKAFRIDNKIKRAMIYVCGLGQFELSLNGQKVGDHVLDPGWTNYRKTCLYVPFDVTELLQSGDNALGVMLGNGMYNIPPGKRHAKFRASCGEPKMILQLRIDYADGTTQIVTSDDSWKTHPSWLTFSCVYGGEDADRRQEPTGWNSVGFDEVNWKAVRVVQRPGGTLQSQDFPAVKVLETLKPRSIKSIKPGVYEADMDQNLQAMPVITVKGDAGSTVLIKVAERQGRPWEGHYYKYTLRGDGEETFRPHFSYFGFQFIYVHGVHLPGEKPAEPNSPELLEVRSEHITTSSRPVGRFSCSNPLMNDINAMIDRSVRSNLNSLLTDCPHREKLGWQEVVHLMAPSIFYNYDVHNLYRKLCQDQTNDQAEDGFIPGVCPNYKPDFKRNWWTTAPEWGSSGVQTPWLVYKWYGDREILTRQYKTMAAYTRYLAGTRNEQGLAKGTLGDWFDWVPTEKGSGHNWWLAKALKKPYQPLTPVELTATAFLGDNARICATVARMQGNTAEAEEFAKLASEVRQAFIAAYWKADAKSVSTGSQAALATALHFRLVPEEDRPSVLANLIAGIKRNEYRQSTGEVCWPMLIAALTDAGRSDIVYKMVNRTNKPGYGYMLSLGFKTLSETWDGPGSSMNHCMFGHIQEWFISGLLGIRQTEDSIGFEKLLIAPLFVEGLDSAQGHFDSPRGRVGVSWRRAGENIELSVGIPANTTAEICLPTTSSAAITESGKALDEHPELTFAAVPEKGVAVKCGSGDYRFVFPM